MAQPDATGTTSEVHGYRARVAEHGRFRAVMESFAYLPPFGAMFKKTSPFYAESYWYCMGGITFLMFVYLTISGVILAWLGPFWWLTNPFGKVMKGTHYWSAQAFFFFLVLHLIRVWATGAFRGRRWLRTCSGCWRGETGSLSSWPCIPTTCCSSSRFSSTCSARPTSPRTWPSTWR